MSVLVLHGVLVPSRILATSKCSKYGSMLMVFFVFGVSITVESFYLLGFAGLRTLEKIENISQKAFK